MVAAIMLMFFCASAVQAQRTGSRIGHDATAKDGVTVLRMIAECYNSRSTKGVRQLLDTLPGTPEETRIMKADADKLSPCLDSDALVMDGKMVTFKAPALRRPLGAEMARELFAKDKATFRPAPDAKPWFVDALAALSKGAAVDHVSLAIQDFGHCVALAKWDEARSLLLSKDNSKEEIKAVQAIIPALGPCLTSGSEIRITKRNLREIIGEPVYHLLHASQNSGNL